MVLGQCESGVREGSGLGAMYERSGDNLYESGVRDFEILCDNLA